MISETFLAIKFRTLWLFKFAPHRQDVRFMNKTLKKVCPKIQVLKAAFVFVFESRFTVKVLKAIRKSYILHKNT